MAGFLIAVVAFLVVVTIVVVVHEGGHFLAARASGIAVEEFAVGFGPRVLSRQRGETVYSVRALPVGGFVRMPGMLGLEGETDMGERNFNRATIPRRAVVIVAGVLCNLVFGAICWSVAFTQPTQSQVVSGDPAAHAGIPNGAVILRQAGVGIDQSSLAATTASFRRADAATEGRPSDVVYRAPGGGVRSTIVRPALVLYPNVGSGPLPSTLRGAGAALVITQVDGHAPGTGDPAAVLGGGATVTIAGHLDGAPARSFSGVSISGVRGGDGTQPGYTAAWRIGYLPPAPGLPLPQAFLSGFQGIPSYTGQVVSLIGQLFVRPAQAGSQFLGPVGIAAVAGSAVQQGWVQFVFFLGEISIALGLMNVLPLPFLDGGRLLFIGIEAVRHRQISPQRQAAAIVVSLGFIILLGVLITISNISQISSGGLP